MKKSRFHLEITAVKRKDVEKEPKEKVKDKEKKAVVIEEPPKENTEKNEKEAVVIKEPPKHDLPVEMQGPKKVEFLDTRKKTLAQNVIKMFGHKVHEHSLEKLKEFKIPDQRRLLSAMVHSDFTEYDFGGYLRMNYSPMLRNYSLNNMQERYRGAEVGSPCFTALDISKVGTKTAMVIKDRKSKLAERSKLLQGLKAAAVDEKHFRFLKELAVNQVVSIPLTIIHDLAKEILPMIHRMYHYYQKTLGHDHVCTVQAGECFVKLLNRVVMYNSL